MTPHIILDNGRDKTIVTEFKQSAFIITPNNKGTFNFFVRLESDYFSPYSDDKVKAIEAQYQCTLNRGDSYLYAYLQILNCKSIDELLDNQFYTKGGNDEEVIISNLYKGWQIDTFNNYFYFERGENESEILLYWTGFERDIYEDSYANPIEIVAILDIVQYDDEAEYYQNLRLFNKNIDQVIDFSQKSKPNEQWLLNLKELPQIIKKIENNTKIVSDIFKKGCTDENRAEWKRHILVFIDEIMGIINGNKKDSQTWQNNANLRYFDLSDLAQLWETVTNLAISVLQNKADRLKMGKDYVAFLDAKLAEILVPFKMIKRCKEESTTYLDLYDCGLPILPYQLFELHHLETLILGHYYTCYNDLEGFRNTYSRNLKISNTITFLPKQIGQLRNLKRLVFGIKYDSGDTDNRNPIRHINRLINLESLTIHSKKITSLTPLENLKKLQFLDVSECSITEMELYEIGSLTQLEDIEVNATKITTFKWVEQFPNLKRFYGAYYLKDFIDFESAQSFKKLKYLHTLIAYFNDLAIIADLENLRVVYIEAQDILNFDLIHKLKNLERLGTNSKEITDFEFLKHFENLEVLDLDDTNIADLEPIADLKKLKVLQIDNTRVKTLKPLTLYKNLESINFDNTEIDSLEPLKNCSKLRIVSVSKKVRDLMPITDAVKNSLNLPNIMFGNDLRVNANRDILNDESKAFLDYLAEFRYLGWD